MYVGPVQLTSETIKRVVVQILPPSSAMVGRI